MQSFFKLLSDEIQGLAKRLLIIGIDGVDGAGKTYFAARLKTSLETAGANVVLISIDAFHNPQRIRYVRGKDSAEGFYYDSYNYEYFIEHVIMPFRGHKKQYITAGFDLELDRPINEVPRKVPTNAILIVEGIFLHRPELCACWHYSIYLDVTSETSLGRNIQRRNTDKIEETKARFFTRYRPGQEIYLQQCKPLSNASVIIDNNDYVNPKIIRRNGVA